MGLDTVAVVGRTTERLLAELRHQRVERTIDRQTGYVFDRSAGASLDLPVGLGWCRLHGVRSKDGPHLRAELSIPRMLDGHNRFVATPELLPDFLDALTTVLAEELPDVPQPDELRLNRVDIARDFRDVQSTSVALTALAGRHIPHARRHAAEHRPDGHLQCLTRGSPTQWLVRGYDKGEEMRDAARKSADLRDVLRIWSDVTAGVLRYEVQLRAPILRRKGIITMSDATPDRVDHLAREYFQRAGWDASYGGPQGAQRVFEGLSTTLSAAEQRNLMVWVYCQEKGISSPPLSRHAVEAARPLARRLNLVGDVQTDERRRLDFDLGQEVSAS